MNTIYKTVFKTGRKAFEQNLISKKEIESLILLCMPHILVF